MTRPRVDLPAPLGAEDDAYSCWDCGKRGVLKHYIAVAETRAVEFYKKICIIIHCELEFFDGCKITK